MKYRRNIVIAIGLALLATLPTAPATAQNSRSYVSPTGNDSNPCSLTAPCRWLQAALARTNPGGEIAILGTAGYNNSTTVTIDKAISIVNPGAFEAGIIVPSGGTGITINAGPNDAVKLRGLTIEGQGVGYNGVVFNSGQSLTVQDCIIHHMANVSGGSGLVFTPTTASRLAVSRTSLSDNGAAGLFARPNGVALIVINNVEANNNTDGIVINGTFTSAGQVRATVTNTVVSGNSGAGIYADAFSTMPVMLDRLVASNNGYGIISSHLGSQVVFNRSVITGNTHGWASLNSGTVLTYGNNAMDYNDGDQAAPGGLTPK